MTSPQAAGTGATAARARVVVDATMLDGLPSGAATRLAALGAAHAARGRLHVVHLLRPGVDALPGLARRDFPGATTPWGRARAGRRFDAAARAERAAVFAAGALPLPRLSAAPAVLTLHDLRLLSRQPGVSLARRLWARRSLPRNLARAAHVVAVSRHTADGLLAAGLLDAARVTVVPNAATPHLHPVTDPDRVAAFRRRAGLNRRYVLAVGPLVPHKRPRLLLQALAAARARPGGDDLGLVLAGRADPAAALVLARRAAALGLADHVRLLGLLDDATLSVAYAGADALLVASTTEGFCIPVVDAQRLGVPVVAPAAGALPEIAGAAARLLPPGPDLADALGAALVAVTTPGTERDDLIAAGRTAASRWSWDTSAATLEDIWLSLAS